MRKTVIFLGILVMLLGAAVAYFVMTPGADEILAEREVITDQGEIDALALAFIQPPYRDDYQMVRVAGYIDNFSEYKIAEADLEIQMFDADGNKKELDRYTVNNIPADSRKSFDANAGSILSQQAELEIVRIELIK